MSSLRFRIWACFLVSFAFTALSLRAQTGPAITLEVDATQAPQSIIHTHMVIPVKPGPLTLYYPKWIPGEHAPDGPILDLVGLKLSAQGKRIPWRRDLLDMFTFHVNIPDGVHSLEVSFDYVEPGVMSGFTAGASTTDKLAVISWNQDLLYPAGRPAQDLTYQATLKLPAGWKFGTALPVAGQNGNVIKFKPASLNRLVDSPVISGQYFRVVNVTPSGEPIHHEIDLAADSEEAAGYEPGPPTGLHEPGGPEPLSVRSRHYRDYHFLLSLSNHVAHFGLEHHESDDSRVGEFALINPQQRELMAFLLPHEFVHSWNGKFRRPKDLSPPYYEAPQKTDMLWVYEGLNRIPGQSFDGPQRLVDPGAISPSSGPDRCRAWARAAGAHLAPARRYHCGSPNPLFCSREWTNWRRSVDFYDEGVLLWLEVDMIIHQQTHGQKSLDDFCRLFYGGPNKGPQLKTYTFQDLVGALESDCAISRGRNSFINV